MKEFTTKSLYEAAQTKKKSLDEMARTMIVIPEDEMKNYWGMYDNDCFWRCIAYLSSGGISYSESDAEYYARDYWMGKLGYNDALIHLSAQGGDMSISDIEEFASTYSISGVNLDCLRFPINQGTNVLHAVILTGTEVIQGITFYNYFDPSTNTSFSSLDSYL